MAVGIVQCLIVVCTCDNRYPIASRRSNVIKAGGHHTGHSRLKSANHGVYEAELCYFDKSRRCKKSRFCAVSAPVKQPCMTKPHVLEQGPGHSGDDPCRCA